MNSTILNCLEINQLKELCNLNSNWKLLYRTKDNGFKISEFYAQCKEHSPTLMIIKTTKNYVFGGYTKANWTCNNDWISDKSAFIFSLINMMDKPQFMKVESFNNAIRCDMNGQSFGHDVFIVSSSNKYRSYSRLGTDYNYNRAYPFYFLGGSPDFMVQEIEVFHQI